MKLLAETIFILSGIGIVASFAAGPAIIFITYLIRGKSSVTRSDNLPKLSIIIVGRNAEDVIEKKIKNTLELDYPADKREIIFYSDGSSDGTENMARKFQNDNIHVYSSKAHCGKINGMNEAVKVCWGELLIFTDIDVMLDAGALLKLTPYFGDPSIGGVSGAKVVVKDNTKLEDAQNIYTKWAGSLKWMENTLGCITTNDGTLYAIRKELYQEIPPAVTDDLYVCLSVIRQNRRFLYDPNARAFMPSPSRDIGHEIRRRRRIVSTSLRSILLSCEVLNPFKHGVASWSLFFNKVLRRFVPLFMITLLPSNIALAFHHPVAQWILSLQCIFYFFALLYGVFLHRFPSIPIVTKLTSLPFYFCLGNFGTLLGLLDFAKGKQISKW